MRQIVVPFVSAFGGVERLVIALGRYLESRKLPHQVLCFDDTLGLAAHAGYRLDVKALHPPRRPLAEAWSLRSHFAATSGPPPLFFDLKGAFYAGLAGLSRHRVHLTDPPSLLPRDVSKHAPSLGGALGLRGLRAEVVHRINRRGLARAGGVIAMTDAVAREIEALYGIAPHVVRPGVTRRPRAQRPPIGDQPLHALSVCRLESSKRVDWILRALASSPPPWRLSIVGDGPDRPRLQQLAGELGGAVQFHGRISDEDLERLYAAAHLFVMPAVQGYGLPALESLERGLPVVVHADSGVSEILGGSPWVEVVSGGAEELARAVADMAGRLRRGELERSPPPPVPDESDWAARICEICEWN
jgi:glycosyltransferase involved in cell wall biosynthesis